MGVCTDAILRTTKKNARIIKTFLLVERLHDTMSRVFKDPRALTVRVVQEEEKAVDTLYCEICLRIRSLHGQ